MNLLEVQRSLRGWLTAESAEAAARLGDSAAPGLAVHLNTYRSQLLLCLGEIFGALRAWLGDAAFEAAAATHIDRVPPSSWTLDDYARDFPDTLRLLYPADPEVGELACLERALADIFTAPDCVALTPDTVDQVEWVRINWDRAVLRLVPTFTLLSATSNAAAIWSAIQGGTAPPAAERLPLPTQLVVWRKGYSPNFRVLEPLEADALDQIAAALPFGGLCEFLVERCGETEAPQRAAAWLGQWLRDGLILEIG